MNHPYGPWATLITAGQNPQLSAFWRRRLHKLVPLSQAGPTLSRRGVAALLATACGLLLLPTFQTAPADAQQQATKESGGQRNAAADAAEPADGKPATMANLSPSDPDRGVVLPYYRLQLLMQAPVLEQLHVTAGQEQKLVAIQRQYDADNAQIYTDALKAKPVEKKLAEAHAQWNRQQRKKILGQVEQVLSVAQLQSLAELRFQEYVFVGLMVPEELRLEPVLTKAQEEQYAALRKECTGWYRKEAQADIARMRSTLTPQQQARLRQEALGPLGPDDNLQQVDIHIKGEAGPLFVYSLHPYPDPTDAWLYKELDLSAAQQREVRGILGGSKNLAEALAREVAKLPPDEGKRLPHVITIQCRGFGGGTPEQLAKIREDLIRERKQQRIGFADNPMMKPAIALREKFEAVLTPRQLAAYRDLAVQNVTAGAQSDETLLTMIGVSQRQIDELQRGNHGRGWQFARFNREWGGKLLEILSPAQRKRLWAEFETSTKQIELNTGEIALGDSTPDGTQHPAATVPSAAVAPSAAGAVALAYRDPTIVSGGALLLAGSGANPPAAKPAPAAKNAPASRAGDDAAQIKALIPAATAMSQHDFDKLMGRGEPLRAADIEQYSLTMGILTYRPRPHRSKEAIEAFDLDSSTTQCKASSMRAEIGRQAEDANDAQRTYFHADHLTGITCKVSGDTAAGSVSFRVPGQFKGKFDFVARRKGEKWRITAVSMPALGISLVCDEQGKWTSVSPAAKPAPAPAVVDPTSTDATSPEGADAMLDPALPAYAAIGNAELRKQFGINLSTEQTERLRRLAADWAKDFQEWDQAIVACRTQVESVLTPRIEKKLALSAQQKAAIQRIYQQGDDRRERIHRETQRKSLALLTRQQQEKLRQYMQQQGW